MEAAAISPFFAATPIEDKEAAKVSDATDALADCASADISRIFRDRYATIRRTIEKSKSAQEAMTLILQTLSTPLDDVSLAPFYDVLVTNALNATR